MVLILEVTSANASELGSSAKKVFGPDGGLIGRDRLSAWVLPQPKVSNRHAVISFQNGIFYIEDTNSSNGVYINSSRSRLTPGRPYALKAGDYILIDPYVIQVSISSEIDEGSIQPPPRSERLPAFSGTDAFSLDDPFGERRAPPAMGPEVTPQPQSGQEVDPLKLLDAGSARPPSRVVPRARDLDEGSALQGHYQPPPVASVSPRPEAGDPFMIPADYDPLSPDSFHPGVRPRPRDIQPPLPPRRERAPDPVIAVERPPEPVPAAPPPPPAQKPEPVRPAASAPAAVPPIERVPQFEVPPPAPTPPKVRPSKSDQADLFAKVFTGAGLPPDVVTPELAQNFGEILRVVVEGVMEILRARQEIKDEFRMRMTQFRPSDNNPLKFSANVDDALHNLLVKRNAAYLGAVEAFKDAFDDLRSHQLAMLSGMRTAFESMLAEFDPDKLQEQFDRQVKRASLFGGPAKLRYWDLYRDRRDELVRDPEKTFQKLFGEVFAKAYEEQLQRLRVKDRDVDD